MTTSIPKLESLLFSIGHFRAALENVRWLDAMWERELDDLENAAHAEINDIQAGIQSSFDDLRGA